MTKKISRTTKKEFIDYLSETLFSVSIYFMLYRILTVFIITNIYGYQWSIRRDFGSIPILAFEMNLDEFARMNANSQIITAVLILIGFILTMFRKPKQHFKKDRYAWKLAHVSGWFLGVLMSMIMYFVAIYINPGLRFETKEYTGIAIVLINIIGLLCYVIYTQYLSARYSKTTKEKLAA